jgi:hypothetical protein
VEADFPRLNMADLLACHSLFTLGPRVNDIFAREALRPAWKAAQSRCSAEVARRFALLGDRAEYPPPERRTPHDPAWGKE